VTTRYDVIGRSYSATRQTDPRIGAQINRALGNARTVVNVGAGTGSYESDAFTFTAVEPSMTMLRQRAADAAPAIRGVAEALPFADHTFDAALTILSAHHWSDIEQGLREMQRVSSRQVVFYFEPEWPSRLWLFADYFPWIRDLVTEHNAPDTARLSATLSVQRIETVMVSSDCLDGFGGSFWSRPEAYLDPLVQDGMSCFSQMNPTMLDEGMARLRADLASGAWDTRYGHLRELSEMDLGYRLLVA
jgi:ubiquinone/menaquinone biosynthesis C-methylase UbiE